MKTETHVTSTLFFVLLLTSYGSVNAQDTGGPYTPDANTILLMHFDGNLNEEASNYTVVDRGATKSYVSNPNAGLGDAIYFDNNTAANRSYVTVPYSPELSLSSNWTIEFWFRINAWNQSHNNWPVPILLPTSGWNANYYLEIPSTDGRLKYGFSSSDGGAMLFSSPNSITTGRWYHVALINDYDNHTIRLNLRDADFQMLEEQSSSYAAGTTISTGTQDLRIGNGTAGDNAFNGYIDELRISNVVRDFSSVDVPPVISDLPDQARIERKVSAFNLHRMKYNDGPFHVVIETLLPAEYEARKPAGALPFDVGYVDATGKVYVSEPTTADQQSVFSDLTRAALYYVSQSFLQYYYRTSEMPLWFKIGFASYEADMRLDDADIKTAYTSYGGTLTSFAALNDPNTFVANNGFAVSYMFGEFMGVLEVWSYPMFQEVNASTVVPVSWWDNVESLNKLFEIWSRYFSARILEENNLSRIKLGRETDHFKFYYRDSEASWAAYFPDVLEDALTEYIGLLDFEVFEKFSYITMPECDFALIGGRDCINRYTGGTAWSSGLSTTSPNNTGDFDRFRRLIRHELAHITQSHLPARNMTAWLNEGYASFMGNRPFTQEKIDALQSQTENALNDAINYFGHLPTFEDTKVYPGQSNVEYYLFGEIMLNFIHESGGYSAVKDVMIDHETGIANMGYASPDAFMAAYYHYVNVRYLKVENPDYFVDYDSFITKITNLTSSADSTAKLNAFWSALVAEGNFPFVLDTRVAFLYRGSAGTVNWAGTFNNWDMNADPGTRLGVSDVWLLEKEFLSDTRSEYKIVRNGSEWLADPYNPHPLVGDFGNSELWMPGYSAHTELIVRPETAKGTLSNNIQKNSSNLGYLSQYRVYTPAGYSTLSNLPVVYVTDGQNYLDDSMGKMVIVLDNLIADAAIVPVIAVFLDPRDPGNLSDDRRGSEYRNNMNFVNYVTRELLPEIDAAYRTYASADARAMMGASYGGYNAEYFSVVAGDYFHNIGMNSPYLHPEGNYNIDSDLQAADLSDMSLFLSYGTFDADGERYYNRLKNIFDQKGIVFESAIVGDGHTWQNWSRVTGDALQYFFSSIEIAPPVVSDIPDQSIDEGSSFSAISLDDYVTDPDDQDSQITWSFSGNSDLSVVIDGSRVATVLVPDEQWVGAETIAFTARDPGGASATDSATFTVTEVNVPPVVVNPPGDIEMLVGGEAFDLDLTPVCTDADDDAINYSATSSNDAVATATVDGYTLTVTALGKGTATITVTASDGRGGVANTSFIVDVPSGVAVERIGGEVPTEYALNQNFPNPFNPITTIQWALPEAAHVVLRVYNMQGILIATLMDESFPAGRYSVSWDASGHASGVYLLRIAAGNYVEAKMLTLIK